MRRLLGTPWFGCVLLADPDHVAALGVGRIDVEVPPPVGGAPEALLAEPQRDEVLGELHLGRHRKARRIMGDQGLGVAVRQADQAGPVAGGRGVGGGRRELPPPSRQRGQVGNEGAALALHFRGLSSETWLGEA